MQIVDLSYLINADISMYPGTEPPIFQDANTIDHDGFAELKITMHTHTATHIDAPCHIYKNGKSLDQFPVDKFYGRGIVLDCRSIEGDIIGLDFISKYEGEIKRTEFVLFHTGWSSRWKTDAYFERFPTLSFEAANYLATFSGLKGIGLDNCSLDKVEDSDLPNHHVVLRKEILIIENLTNLDCIAGGNFIFQCLPIKIENADGSPVRAIALLNE